MIQFDFDKYCYGCGLCSAICPTNAIDMKANREGFLVPYINTDVCIKCGLCQKNCIHYCENENQVLDSDMFLAAYRKENSGYKKYTSSGLFYALAKKIIAEDGYVVGCVWNNEMEAVHIISNSEADIEKMTCSKYVQSSICECFEIVKERIKTNKVFFCGTPCQVKAIKQFVGDKGKNLYTMAIVCHGTPSPAVWKRYKNQLETEMSSKMVNANFRYKGKYGWITPFTKYEFSDGKQVCKLSFTEDPYVIAFGEDMIHRSSCYNCKFKGSNSDADLIAGDYWGCSTKLLKKSRNRGINSIIVHTEKGKELLEKVNSLFAYEETSLENICRENKPVLEAVEYNKNRESFFETFIKTGDTELLCLPMKQMKFRIKRYLYKLSLFELLKRMKYMLMH